MADGPHRKADAVSTAGAVEGPLTWGQQDIWRAVEAAQPQEHYLNITRVFDAPKRPTTIERGLEALAALIERHESLRTRLTGTLTRAVHPTATPGVEITEEPARQVADRLAATPFDYVHEWPLRVAFTAERGFIRQIAIVLCHLAADGHAADLVERDFRLLLIRDSLKPLKAQTPTDLATWQTSPEGRRLSQDAITWWKSEYTRLDPIQAPKHPPGTPRFKEATMHSTAIAVAAQSLAARHQVSSSTILLRAAMTIAGRLTNQRHCGMRVIVNNRHHPDLRDVVSTISQEALVVLDLHQEDLTKHTWTTAMRAYRQARYDPCAMDGAVSPIGTSFGCFNDQRLVHHDAPLDVPAQETELVWTDAMDRNICDFRLHLGGEPARMEVSLYADTALLPAPDIEAYLRAMESLLVEEAAR